MWDGTKPILWPLKGREGSCKAFKSMGKGWDRVEEIKARVGAFKAISEGV